MKNSIKIGDYKKIMSDHNIFNQVVYTPLSEALRLLDERRKDPVLMAKVEKLLKKDVPQILKNRRCAVLFRQVATPNYESRMFIKLAKENIFCPVFFEYHDDKFTPENKFKYSLGKLTLYNGVGKHGGSKNEFFNVINFNKSNGKKLKNLVTTWEEPLTDFHKKLFAVYGYDDNELDFYDISSWCKNNGKKAKDYYTNFILLFICHGILFENFLLNGTEGDFTKNIFLPAFEKASILSGVKPLIVPFEPISLENDSLWYNHLPKIKRRLPQA